MAYCHDDSKAPSPSPRSRPARQADRRYSHRSARRPRAESPHAHMMAIYFMHYNFVRIHQTLRITPAMAAGVTKKLWEMADMVKVLEEWEAEGN